MESLKLEDVEVMCALFEEYSKNSVFQITEYADVAKVHTKLQGIFADKTGKLLETIELQDLVYLIKLFQIASTRYKTPIQNWERILTIYKKIIQVAQDMEKSAKNTSLATVEEETSIEELPNLNVSEVPSQ